MNAAKIRNAVDTLEQIQADRVAWNKETWRLAQRWYSNGPATEEFRIEALALFNALVDHEERTRRQYIIDGVDE